MYHVDGITTKEAARRLDLTPQRIRQLMKAGKLTHIQTPLGRLIDPLALERFQVQRHEASNSPRQQYVSTR